MDDRKIQELQRWVFEHQIDEGTFNKRFPGKIQKQGASSSFYESGGKAVRKSKVIDVVEETDMAYRLMTETEIMETPSPYIAKLIQTFVVKLDDKIYVAHILELATLGSLDTHIPDKGMDINTGLACMQQVFSGLAELERLGIVHYDIKPANILVYRNGRLKLTDFDVALRVVPTTRGKLVADNSDDEMKHYPVAGTPNFVAPEVARAKVYYSERDDSKAKARVKLEDIRITAVEDLYKLDVFSAGISFLQCITNFMRRGDKHTLANGTVVLKLKDRRLFDIESGEELGTLNVRDNTLNAGEVHRYRDRSRWNWNYIAMRIEEELRGRACKRCRALFQYTLQRDPSRRKSAAWIVNRMTKWTWRPGRFGFDDAKSKSIIATTLGTSVNKLFTQLRL